MKIGIICSKPPVPVIDGGNFASKSLIELLAESNELDCLFFETAKHPFTSETKTFSEQIFTSYSAVKINTAIKLIPLVRDLFLGKSYHLSRFTNEQLKNELNEFLTKNFDYLILDSLFSAAELTLIKKKYKGKIILRTHNLEHEIWERNTTMESNFLKRFALKTLTKTLKKLEVEIFNKVDQIWAISEKDCHSIEQLTTTKTCTIPVSIDFISNEKKTTTFCAYHLGGMNWKPNELAVEYLLEEIWRDDFTIPLKIAGNGTNTGIQSANKNIEFLGRVNDLEKFYEQVSLLVVPTLSGSGIRIKILEALAHGIPCITTQIGAEGIDIEKSGLQIVNSAELFRNRIQMLETNKEFYAELSQKAINYIEANHSKKSILGKIHAHFNGK